jgi:lipoprotein-releasing system ATP-binding protein
MKAEPILHVKDLVKSFSKGPEVIEVLKGITMEITAGEGIAIVGASGTGKSTLLHLLGGLERPDQGKILHEKRDICTMNDREMALFRNKQIGFVFQFHFLLPEFTAVENVMMPALVSEKKTDETMHKALYLLETVGLKDRISHKPGELSGGEQQRVAIARSLMMSPKVLLADEPTGDLDPTTGQKIIELFSQLKNTVGVTMIIATHNMELAKTMDRIMILKGGHLELFTS